VTSSADVIVLGGGLAGCRAALEARSRGASVILLAPAKPGQTGNSSRASGGFATALPPHDDWQAHYDDFLNGGYGINDAALVKLVTQNAGAALESLAGLVDGFLSSDGGFELKQVPAHDRPRSAQYALGMERLMSALGDELTSNGVRILTGHTPVDLLQDETGKVCGAISFNADGERVDLRCKSLVLATGGCGDLFPVTSNAPGTAGEGYAMALRAGCRLRDMEFIQFTPTAFAAPPAVRGQTIVGSLLSLPGVHLLNNRRERFMRDYDPDNLERADRATLARAIQREILAGRGSDSGGVYLDISSVAADEINRHRPGFLEWLHDHGIDPANEPLQTAPSAHTCLGGVAVDPKLSAKPGLYAAGEALGGTHGANRLSSNSLTEANVTGCIAGANAAAHAGTLASLPTPAPGNEAVFIAAADIDDLCGELRQIMGNAAGVERQQASIDAGMDRLAELMQEFAGARASARNPSASVAVNRILACQAILAAARLRTESRGCHARSDFAERNDRDWLGNIYLTFENGQLEADYRPLPESS
jgi:fumarate reductase (CoM/CoB) subunit A